MSLHVNTNACAACFRIIETKRHEVSIPNVFGFELDMVYDLCNGCSSFFDWCVDEYIELNKKLSKKLTERQFHLTQKTQKGMR